MAIYYKLIKNQIKSSKNYGKYYAHTVKQGKVSMEQIEQTIQENCTAKASDVRLVLRELFDTVKQYMQDGWGNSIFPCRARLLTTRRTSAPTGISRDSNATIRPTVNATKRAKESAPDTSIAK